MSERSLILNVVRDGERVQLLCPAVGTFSRAVGAGRALVAGESVGVLTTLGASFELLVPDDVSGVVVSQRPERVLEPVDFGAVLYELSPLAANGEALSATRASDSASGALVFRSPSAGRFWHRSAPGDAAMVQVGDVLEPGRALGLIEVMKTFTLVSYAAAGGLPTKARVARILVEDGAEVADRTPLLELDAN